MTAFFHSRFAAFSYLQVLDILTTLAFLVNGVQEGNPLVRFAIERTANPVLGLVAVKVAAVMMGLYCWLSHRHQLLGRINVFFGAIVAWNLVAMIVAAGSR
jgi:hypothetical protein